MHVTLIYQNHTIVLSSQGQQKIIQKMDATFFENETCKNIGKILLVFDKSNNYLEENVEATIHVQYS